MTGYEKTNIARRNDPATSHAAAREITYSGRRATQSERLHGVVRRNPGQTSGMIRELSGMSDTQVSRRLADLENAGIIHKGQKTELYRGRPHSTWYNGPAHIEVEKPNLLNEVTDPHCKTCNCFDTHTQSNMFGVS